MNKPNAVDRARELDNAFASSVNQMAVKGLPVLVDPEDAEVMGAVLDDSIEPADVMASRFDHIDYAA